MKKFSCPQCHGTHFGTEGAKAEVWVRRCHDEYGVGCRWKGLDSECFKQKNSMSSDWKAVKNLRSTGWFVECDGVELATVNERLANLTSEQAEANARKMAAAPELLAALKAAYATFYDPQCELGLQVAAAIAKAEGAA